MNAIQILMLLDHQTSTCCHSKYKKLSFGCEHQEFLIGSKANYFSLSLKFLLGGFLTAGPYCKIQNCDAIFEILNLFF